MFGLCLKAGGVYKRTGRAIDHIRISGISKTIVRKTACKSIISRDKRTRSTADDIEVKMDALP